jgi:hypothetical protein
LASEPVPQAIGHDVVKKSLMSHWGQV